ncbi:MAG: hypothetical protein ABUT20_49545, partial [Bacteroidota bacterium]
SSLIKRGDSIARTLDDPELQIRAMLRMSNSRTSINASEAVKYALQAEELARKHSNKILLARVQGTIGNIY